jgi:predicted DNA-binding transcriptional regulator AlpA
LQSRQTPRRSRLKWRNRQISLGIFFGRPLNRNPVAFDLEAAGFFVDDRRKKEKNNKPRKNYCVCSLDKVGGNGAALIWRYEMPYFRYDTEGMTTMREAARLVGLSHSWYWRLVKERGLLEAPANKVGERTYYDATQIERVVKQVAELRRKGVIG